MKKVYFVGIKGVGMTPLALLAKEAGIEVAGVDVAGTFITDTQLKKAGIPVHTGFDAVHIDDFLSNDTSGYLLIFTAAHGGVENIEVQRAKEKKIKTLSLGSAIGKLMDGDLWGEKKIGVSIAGTHGKTTTAALVAHMLVKLKEDPSYLIGSSDIFPLGSPAHWGKGKHLVVEADEYVSDAKTENTPKFLKQYPDVAIITNIDFDHPDVFADIEAVKSSFVQFAHNVKKTIVINMDDENSIEVIAKSGKKYVTFGMGNGADYRYTYIHTREGITSFKIEKGETIHECQIKLSGHHNVANATAAVALLDVLGFPPEKVIPHLRTFLGAKRRSEERGTTANGAMVIDDYAHHPKEIKTTLAGLKQKYNKKIICIFQPHTYSRTQALMKEFTKCFEEADAVLLLPIFASAREKADAQQTEKLYKKMFAADPATHFMSGADAVIKYLKDKNFDSQYLIVTMGAGDVYKIADKIVK